MQPGDQLSIKYAATRSASFSNWAFDPPWLNEGETATIYGWWVADAVNPLYKVRRDRDGAEKAIYRNLLLEYGEINGAS